MFRVAGGGGFLRCPPGVRDQIVSDLSRRQGASAFFTRGDKVADQTVKPVIVPAGQGFPYIYPPAASGRRFGNFTRKLFRQIPVMFLVASVDRQAARIAGRGQKSFAVKRFPKTVDSVCFV